VADLDALHPGPGWRAVVTSTASFLTGLGAGPPLDLAQVRCPVLLLLGSDDAMVTREECDGAVAAMPDARLVLLPGAPHQYERMDTEVLAREIGPFLA
jgi:pimeloyl-ACP methyl ester carboxylesterase